MKSVGPVKLIYGTPHDFQIALPLISCSAWGQQAAKKAEAPESSPALPGMPSGKAPCEPGIKIPYVNTMASLFPHQQINGLQMDLRAGSNLDKQVFHLE